VVDPFELQHEIASELEGNLLPFWRDRVFDHRRETFVAHMANDGTVRNDAPFGLILASRLLWTFAALSRRLGDPQDLELAWRAFEVLESSFRDREHGGYFWQVDVDGRPLDRSKKTYGQAFCIYALSELHLATNDAAPLEAALELFGRIERHAHDPEFGGYLEARAANWSETSNLQLSARDMVAAKSMNTHLHLLEAYTNLFTAIVDPRVARRLDELIGLFDRRIIRSPERATHLDHFFDARWHRLSENRTYGHDIEASWLLCETASGRGEDDLGETVRRRAIQLARSTLAEGLDSGGGLSYEGIDGQVVNTDRDWWCQAEAVVGFWNAYQLTGEQTFADAAQKVWRFIQEHLVDCVNGEWFWRARADGSIDDSEPKVSEWKGPYHTVRMCLEMMRRLDNSTIGEKS
jgi:mannobiose 2-epimerase